jgi:hypothetical protein
MSLNGLQSVTGDLDFNTNNGLIGKVFVLMEDIYIASF